jgi:outer membrane protein assembly factor BamB
MIRIRVLLLLLVAGFVASACACRVQADDWTRFRGENGTGVSENANVPTTWSVDENMKWSVELPGPGSSSPIVCGDRVYVTCYSGYGVNKDEPGNPGGLERHLICFDRNTGEETWRATVKCVNHEDPYTGGIHEHGYATSTPVTDGERVYVFFGKDGVFAFDAEMGGDPLWNVSVGTHSDPYRWGGGASPILYKDLVIINAGIEGHALVALNRNDGTEAWRIDNEKFTSCWSTPVLVEANGRTELVYSYPGQLMGINPDDGTVLWNATSPVVQVVTTSVTAEDDVIYTVANEAIALRCGGEGDISESNTLWSTEGGQTITTPVVYGDCIFWLGEGSVATNADKNTGEKVTETRLDAGDAALAPGAGPGENYASPVVAGGHVYFVTRHGVVHVHKADREMESVAVNRFEGDDSLFNATPAVSVNQLFIRSEKKLYCIQADE